jgi:hypothetical protein
MAVDALIIGSHDSQLEDEANTLRSRGASHSQLSGHDAQHARGLGQALPLRISPTATKEKSRAAERMAPIAYSPLLIDHAK